MQKYRLNESLAVSRLVYGMWRLADDPDTSPKHIQAKIDACLNVGITTIDQADIYGAYGAEELLGTCLKQAPALREKIEIVTKCGIIAPIGRHSNTRVKHYDTSQEHIEHSVNSSLRLMGTDYIDLLLIHRPDPFMDHHETGASLDQLVTSGKVRAVGVSNFKPHDWSLLQSAMKTPLVTNQIEISVVAHDAFTNGDLAFLQERGIHPMAWSPLAGGALFGSGHPPLRAKLNDIADKYEAGLDDIALAFLLAHPAKILPIIGSNRIDRITSSARCCNISLDREDWFEIYSTATGHEVA